MKFIIVKKEDLSLQGSYEADVKDDTSANRSWLQAEPVCAHLELPEGLDPATTKAVLVDDVITLVEDTDKVAAKAAATKEAQIVALKDVLDAAIYAQMATVFQTTKSDSASAYLETWKMMLESPEDYVAVTGLADAAAVTAYAQGKLAEAKVYSIWRLQKINEFMIAKAAILGA